MDRSEEARETALEASRAHYAHLAYYRDRVLAERSAAETKRQLDFIEFAFRTHATHEVRDVLDVACGNGRHILALAQRGFRCTGLDYTPEQVQIAQARAKGEGMSVRLLQGEATRLNYESEFDAALAILILFLLPNDDDVLGCLRKIHRALRPGGIVVCNIANPFYDGENWFSLRSIHHGHWFGDVRVPGMRYTSIDRVQDFDPLRGVAWWQETRFVQTKDGVHIFRDRERLRLLTYWDILHYLRLAGFKEIKCYPDWKTKVPKKPKAEMLVFVARKD